MRRANSYHELNLQRINELEDVQVSLENRIARTPTGDERNAICDANIHVLEAIKLLRSVTKEEKV